MATISFWLNAFIPKVVPGYTQIIPSGVHVNKTAVPLPGVARLWPGNTFKDWNAGYLTDQRGFDSDEAASARMHCWAEVDLSKLQLAKQVHRSSGTTQVNMKTGEQTGFAYSNMDRCNFTVKPQSNHPGAPGAIFGASRGGSTFPHLRDSPNGINIDLVAAAGDPLVGMAADIDFGGTFVISVGQGVNSVSISFYGKIDDFPAYDCYATYQGATKPIFTSAPPPGNTVVNLLGNANRDVSGSAVFQ